MYKVRCEELTTVHGTCGREAKCMVRQYGDDWRPRCALHDGQRRTHSKPQARPIGHDDVLAQKARSAERADVIAKRRAHNKARDHGPELLDALVNLVVTIDAGAPDAERARALIAEVWPEVFPAKAEA